jgi:hypothetical protein
MFLLRVCISSALSFSKVTMSFTITFRYHYILLYVAVRLALYRKLYARAKYPPSLCTKVIAAVLPDAPVLESR